MESVKLILKATDLIHMSNESLKKRFRIIVLARTKNNSSKKLILTSHTEFSLNSNTISFKEIFLSCQIYQNKNVLNEPLNYNVVKASPA